MIIVLWGLWGIAAAFAWRYALPRWVFRSENRLLAVGLTYMTVGGLHFLGMVFVEYSGWHFKSMNEEPLEMAGAIVFLYSPIGLPLWVGGPVVLIVDIIRQLLRLGETSQ